ncbi:MAG: hypothetical protein O3B85_06365, partial [Planctomycetota bacterium]|nr:hypothetical protein [Planctomycetota bacterium]
MALAFVHLTPDAIGRLAPGEKITEYGIVAERLADGDVQYSVDARIHGRRVHHVIGREGDDIGVADATEFIAAARAEAAASPSDGADQLIEVEVRRDGTNSTVLRAWGATADPPEEATEAPLDDED